jgi:hypothetical protein
MLLAGKAVLRQLLQKMADSLQQQPQTPSI